MPDPVAPVEPVAAAPSPAPAPVDVPVASAPAPVAAADPAATPDAPLSPAVDTPAPAEPSAPAIDAAPKTDTPKAEPEKPAASSILADAKTDTPTAPAPTGEAVIPTFESYTLPEGASLDEKGLGDFNKVLGQFELDAKADHRLVQDLGQRLVDTFVAQRQADDKSRQDFWVNTRKGWQDEVKNDPVFGRNRYDTFLKDAARVRDKFGSERFAQMLDMTGAGDHPGMMDFVHNVAKFLDRHGLLREGKPVAAPQQRAVPQKAGPRARYQNTSVQ